MSQQHGDHTGSSRKPSRSPTSRKERELPRYKLVLHGEGEFEIMFVVRTIMELTRFCVDEARHKTWEAHHEGRSQLLVTYKERAELYVEQFRDRGLTLSIEPV